MSSFEKYNILSWKKLHFLVTPSELNSILNCHHFVVDNTGVADDYTESNPCEFITKYDALYQKLRNGNRLNWKTDYGIAGLSTGITGHIANCKYQKTAQLNIPDFSEPCIHIDTFCLHILKNQFSTSFWVGQYPENICGLCISFPSKVEFYSPDKMQSGRIVIGDELADYVTYNTIISNIKSITKPLVMEWNNQTKRTTVRISATAKKDIEHFHFVSFNNIQIL